MNDSSHNHDENLKKADRIAYLIAGHIRGTLTEAEEDELDAWVVESDENLELFERLIDEDNIAITMQRHLQIDRDKAEALAQVKQSIGLKRKRGISKLWPYLVAASFVAISISLFLLYNGNKEIGNEKPVAQNELTSDIKPGSDKAVLTLSDGRTIILDSSSTGLLANEGGITIKKENEGEIVYGGTDKEVKFNLVSIPRGGQYRIVLSDGTKVWLNAESSLKYPSAFTANDREVELRGEGYFEVIKSAERPFKVKIIAPVGDGVVEVLGTHFNINGYCDEKVIKTTLLEGSIKVEKNGKTKILAPGEQALIGEAMDVIKPDVSEETAWKDGMFLFRDASIESIGEQIKRWYDIEVVYQEKILQHFNLEIKRNEPLSRLLQLLESTGQVKFSLIGKKLIIKS